MLVIPAIDIKDGQCVRLRQGRMDDVTVFGADPVAMARHWFDAGCERLHLVDLDGAVAGAPRNAQIIRAISAAGDGIPVQVGGGIREIATIAGYLDAGMDRVIVGTRAIAEPSFLEEACTRFPQRILLGLDARDGMLATHGWGATTNATAAAFTREVAHLPLAGIVYTDIGRDGMRSGPNLEATARLARHIAPCPVIASGGVARLDDLDALRGTGALAVIIGKALYEGAFSLEEALTRAA